MTLRTLYRYVGALTRPVTTRSETVLHTSGAKRPCLPWKGVAERSESFKIMIAGGNHSAAKRWLSISETGGVCTSTELCVTLRTRHHSNLLRMEAMHHPADSFLFLVPQTAVFCNQPLLIAGEGGGDAVRPIAVGLLIGGEALQGAVEIPG